VLRRLFGDLGWTVTDFHPAISRLGNVEARLRRLPRPDLVWVPCFRQRDLPAAARWARRQRVPLVFDPLISAYDKQVDERGKLSADSAAAKNLLQQERALFRQVDCVIADTVAHAAYFEQTLGVPRDRIRVVYVGAEERLFSPETWTAPVGKPVEVLFFGSFIPLQGAGVVVEAARLYDGPEVHWTLLGQGPLRDECESMARGLHNVSFEDWLPYGQLPARIHRAGILLGVFGTTPKADRVIPNKVYQSLACGRVVITRSASAYPEALAAAEDSGLAWTVAGDAQMLADAVAQLAGNPGRVQRLGKAAGETSRDWFSTDIIRQQLGKVLATLNV